MDSFKRYLSGAIVGGSVFAVGALGGYLCARRGNGEWLTFVPYTAAGIGFSLGCYWAFKDPSEEPVAKEQSVNKEVSAAARDEPDNRIEIRLLDKLLPEFQKLQNAQDKMKEDIAIDVSEIRRKFDEQSMLTETKMAQFWDVLRSREQGSSRLLWATDSPQGAQSYLDRNNEGKMTMQPFSKRREMLSLATDSPSTQPSKRNPKDMSKVKIFEKPEGSEQESSEDVSDEMRFRV